MLVSIIIPFYNVELYFRRCLESILHQSYRKIEVILINDCSVDNSIDIASEYVRKDTRITIIEHEENLRQGGARNSGVAMARGDYIWFIDADDELTSPFALEHLVQVAQRDNADIVIFNGQAVFEDGETATLYNYYPYVYEQIFEETRPFYPIFYNALMHGIRTQGYFGAESCFRLFKRSFLSTFGFRFLEHTIHEDIVNLVLLPLATRITLIPNIYYNYYQRSGSTMNSHIPLDYLDHLERQLAQIDDFYHQYWRIKEFNKAPLESVMLQHTSWHMFRLISRLGNDTLAVRSAYVRYYDLLAQYMECNPQLLQVKEWSKMLQDKEQVWRRLLESFYEHASDQKKENLLDAVIRPPELKSKSRFFEKIKVLVKLVKKMIKMLLPYGLIRLIQLHKYKI
ncbi:glycosyltransferase family 2 protein [Entomospira entomophila]|uniref:Glycosyltransferase family 2 protein n=1 Tax=Entomospira entomophila TaxID=2719988 RepID=A0A968G8W3_9SPIO|nr:glycosyltransferase family 2 protein [Entomospira entomophilus]NIZ40087.1 glycosyltransferase family 2 protein [Entomospira entomophilus]WDI35648.1 glycosyltransferase family 2 protein [Entomospira entomophilus]